MHYTWIFCEEEVKYDELYLHFGVVCLDNVDGVPQEDGEHCQLFDFPKVHYKVRKVTKFHGNSSILSMFNTDLKWVWA